MKNEDAKQHHYGELGSDYFWFSGHFALARMLLGRFSGRSAKCLLNIGCGPNEFSPPDSYATVIGADFSFEACRIARSGNPQTFYVCCDAQHLPFREECAAAVVALEILEHCEDDARAVEEFRRVVDKEGIVLVSVPAYRLLWGSHDVWNRHFRRYRAGAVRALAVANRLSVRYLTYYKTAFVLPLFIVRKIKTVISPGGSSHDFFPVPLFVNRLLGKYLYCEAMAARIIPLPAGVSLFAVMTRDDRDRHAPR